MAVPHLLIGIGSPPSQAGFRSLLAFWAGGAANSSPPSQAAGFRSLLAFWAGGAANTGAVAVTRRAVPAGSYDPRWIEWWKQKLDEETERARPQPQLQPQSQPTTVAGVDQPKRPPSPQIIRALASIADIGAGQNVGEAIELTAAMRDLERGIVEEWIRRYQAELAEEDDIEALLLVLQ